MEDRTATDRGRPPSLQHDRCAIISLSDTLDQKTEHTSVRAFVRSSVAKVVNAIFLKTTLMTTGMIGPRDNDTKRSTSWSGAQELSYTRPKYVTKIPFGCDN